MNDSDEGFSIFSSTSTDYGMDKDFFTELDDGSTPVTNEAPGKLMNFRKPWRQNKDVRKSNKRDKKNSRLIKQKMFEAENNKDGDE